MSIKATNWAWSLALPPTVKLVLVSMANHADDEGECWPLQSRIAEMTGLTDRAVRYVMHGLRASGLVRSQGGKGRRGVFFLALEIDEITPELSAIIAQECVSTTKKKTASSPPNRNQIPNSKRNEIPKNRNEVPNLDRNDIPMNRNDIPTNRNLIPNHRTINNHQQLYSKGQTENSVDHAFDEFWKIYPRKDAKGQARKAFEKAIKKISVDQIIEAVKLWPFEASLKPNGDFRPYAATWLNAERWEDQCVIEAQSQPSRAALPPQQAEAFEAARRRWRANGFEGKAPKIEDFVLEDCA